ncbi:MAG: UDP-4-amino-4,6-dideoxy-N-acetyl-beta-L-altrosamine N-acetyltransferase [Caulobacteraceae bacterium]
MTAPVVTLRDVLAEDSGKILAWRNSPEVRPYMYTDHVISQAEHDRWFAGIPGDARRRYWIIQMDEADVGLINLYDIDERNRRCAWAYYLADPAVRGKGIGSYLEYWALQHVFETMGFGKLWCEVLVSNEAVWKLHETHGFKQEARFRQHIYRDEPEDVFGLGILADEWRERRPAMAARLAEKGFAVPA